MRIRKSPTFIAQVMKVTIILRTEDEEKFGCHTLASEFPKSSRLSKGKMLGTRNKSREVTPP
jgi:hypothetical protein